MSDFSWGFHFIFGSSMKLDEHPRYDDFNIALEQEEQLFLEYRLTTFDVCQLLSINIKINGSAICAWNTDLEVTYE